MCHFQTEEKSIQVQKARWLEQRRGGDSGIGFLQEKMKKVENRMRRRENRKLR